MIRSRVSHIRAKVIRSHKETVDALDPGNLLAVLQSFHALNLHSDEDVLVGRGDVFGKGLAEDGGSEGGAHAADAGDEGWVGGEGGFGDGEFAVLDDAAGFLLFTRSFVRR